MSKFYKLICELRDDVPACFSGVFLFGSSLTNDLPEDIDILLVYDEGKDIYEIAEKKLEALRLFQAHFYGFLVHLTTLSEAELYASRLASKVHFETIRGELPSECMPSFN